MVLPLSKFFFEVEPLILDLKSTSFLNKIGDAYYLLIDGIDAIKGYDRIRVAGRSYTRLAVESKFSSIE